MKMGIDPVTHKPVSQVISDLGSISSLTTTNPQNQTNFVKNNLILDHKKDEQVQPMQHQVQYHQFTNQENFQQHVLSEVASSSSSSSSSNLTRLSSPISYTCNTSQAQINSNFDWSDFLHNDEPLVWTEIQQIQQCDIQRVMSSLSLTGMMQSEGEISNKQGGSSEGFEDVACVASKEYQVEKKCEGNSFSGNSFVDGILDKDSEIRATFPEILDASFDY